ncbi:MAG: CoA transferase [Acidobacteria bacterium]|nr:CoA transferase [Acidobacteriota bacterium]
MEQLPLQGVRILAVEQFGAGPFSTLNLADLGAEVIKIEDPTTGGEISRFVPPYSGGGDGLYFQSWNRNKKSVTLNLRQPGSRDVLHDLARNVDIVFNNLRGDQPRRLGLNYDALRGANPKIVCCSLNAFGSQGPQASEPGYDYIIQALTGFMSLTGAPTEPPAACGISIIDHAAGFAAAMAMLSALYAAEKSGVGRDIEVSLLDTAYSMLTYLAIWNLNRDFTPQRYPGSAHQTLVPVQTFATQDGYITIFCGKEHFWKELCKAFEDPGLAEDPRFSTFAVRFENRELVVQEIQRHFRRRTTAEWMERLRGKVPCGPVRSLAEALRAPGLEEAGTIIAVDHPQFGKVREVNTPVRYEGQREEHRRAPQLGEDTEFVLKEYLHYSEERIAGLKQQQVV